MGFVAYIFIAYALVCLFSVASMAYFFSVGSWNNFIVAGVAVLLLLFGFSLASIIA